MESTLKQTIDGIKAARNALVSEITESCKQGKSTDGICVPYAGGIYHNLRPDGGKYVMAHEYWGEDGETYETADRLEDLPTDVLIEIASEL